MNDILYIAGAAAVFLLFLLLLWLRNRKIARIERKARLTERLLSSVNLSAGTEVDYTGLLEAFSDVVSAPSCAVYQYKEADRSVVLKAVRQSYPENDRIGPSYSGLLPYQKEMFLLPASLPADKVPAAISIQKEGEVPLLFIPVGENMILIGPVKKLAKDSAGLLRSLAKNAEPVLNALTGWQEMEERYANASVSQDAVKNFSSVFAHFESVLRSVMEVSAKAVNAAGVLLISSEGSRWAETMTGFDEAAERRINADPSVPASLENLLGQQEWRKISRGDPGFPGMPSAVFSEEKETFFLVRVPAEGVRCLAVYWYSTQAVLPERAPAVLQALSKRLGDIITHQRRARGLADSYVDFLKMIATLMDNLRPGSVGHSELMSRYAYRTAKELKIGDKEAEEIALAAYLSNIGILGMSKDILFKSGKYSEMEFEKMKLHAEAGASIVEATIGNDNIASYIRCHHERMDGYGYPKGLKKEEIPLGARIIFVVQTFLAKITSREYRPALPFDEALSQLKAASGTQLDPKVVNAFSAWYDRAAKEARFREGPLESCWEMRCSPEDVCVNCPAYRKALEKCWEKDGVNCQAHGDQCENCFIHTEYLWRKRRFQDAGTIDRKTF